MPTPVAEFRHHPPLIRSSRRLPTSRRSSNRLTLQEIFNASPVGFQVGTPIALQSNQRWRHGIIQRRMSHTNTENDAHVESSWPARSPSGRLLHLAHRHPNVRRSSPASPHLCSPPSSAGEKGGE